MNLSRTLRAFILLSAVLGTLNACSTLATLDVSSIGDRRTSEAKSTDETLENTIKSTANAQLKSTNTILGFTPSISVVSFNRRVLLLGKVASESDKALVEQIATSQTGVDKVHNYIEVAPQSRGVGQIVTDTWNTTKIRSTLLGIQGVYPARVKIVTYDNVTYVMGILTDTEQTAVTQRVSTTSGVQKVVTLYQTYVTGTIVN